MGILKSFHGIMATPPHVRGDPVRRFSAPEGLKKDFPDSL
jgi:hypothetical protein